MIQRLFKRKSVFAPSPVGMALSYLILGIWTLVVLFPLYWVIITSLKLPIQVNDGPYFLPGIDFQPSLHAWEFVLLGDLQSVTIRPYVNTVVVALISSVLALIIGAAAAYALVRFEYRPTVGAILTGLGCLILVIIAVNLGVPWQVAGAAGLVILFILLQTVGRRFKRALGNNDIAFWIISQRMLPGVATIIPIFIVFQQVNLLDTRLGLIIVYLVGNLPLVIWLMRDYFQTIPIELEECAAIDGASRLRIFWSIVLPLAVPGLVATFLFVLVGAWNEYLFALFLTTKDAQTIPLAVAAMDATRGPQWWYMSVLIVVMIIPVIIFAIILERFIARGLMVGALKG